MATKTPVRFEELADVLRPKDVIDFTGLNKDSIYALIRCGKIQHVRAGRAILIPRWALQAFLDGR